SSFFRVCPSRNASAALRFQAWPTTYAEDSVSLKDMSQDCADSSNWLGSSTQGHSKSWPSPMLTVTGGSSWPFGRQNRHQWRLRMPPPAGAGLCWYTEDQV